MENDVLLQFSGFLNTPQIWKENIPFPYSLFKLKNVPISKLPQTMRFSPSMVLGKRMELFFQYYITYFGDEEVLAHNEQINFEKRTIGEIDFILKNSKTGKLSHVELVYKFYLYDPDISNEEARWIGPNRKDSFPEKLHRLLDKQFPLLYRRETLPLLERLEIKPEEVEQKLCFKANLFIPWKLKDKKDFGNINPEAIRGIWMTASEFEESDFEDAVFFSPKKPDWPIDPTHNTVWYSYTEIRQQVTSLLAKNQSPLLWMKSPENDYSRFFVVWW